MNYQIRQHLPGILRAPVHLARLALALALLVVQAPAMALLVQLYVVSLRLQPTRAREKNQHSISKRKIAKSMSKWKSWGAREGSDTELRRGLWFEEVRT